MRSDSDSDSAGLAVDPVDPADSADSADSAVTSVAVFELVPDLVDDLLSLALLTALVLHSLDLRNSAHLLLIHLFYFSISLFPDETILAFLTCLAVLYILYRPVKI